MLCYVIDAHIHLWGQNHVPRKRIVESHGRISNLYWQYKSCYKSKTNRYKTDLNILVIFVCVYCRIDVPILNNQFDASLIVLKKKFCWSYLDIFYTSQNKGKHKRKDLSAEATKRLLSPEVNFGDQILYESINKTWWRQSEVNQRYFWDEVSW